MFLSAILLAVSCNLNTLGMIKPPPDATSVVPSSAIPYPGRSDGSIRLTFDHLGAFYGSLNALLQRRFFPFWNESLPANYAALSASDLPTYDFTDKNYRTCYYYWELYAYWRLGDYFNPTNRDFSGDGRRIWRGAEILKNVLKGDSVGISKAPFDDAYYIPHYWLAVVPGKRNMDSTITSGADEYIAGFVVNDPSAHQTLLSADSPMFLGDLNFRPLLGNATPFSWGGYKELLEEDTGLLPKWAAKAVEYKGLPSFEKRFSGVSSAGSSPDGSVRCPVGKNAADVFLGDDAWANLDMADISKTVSPRVWWGQFALANFVLSLMKVQFLGMKQAHWQTQMSNDHASKEKWHSCPSVRYSRQRFDGSYEDSVTATVPGIVYTGFTPGAGHTFLFDWEAVKAATETVTPTENSSISFDSPENCKYITAGWRDNEGYLYYTITTGTSVNYPDSLYQDPYDAQPTDPFAADPESIVDKRWAIEGRSFDPDTGEIDIWIVPGEVDGGSGEKDPNAKFSDGETEKLWKRMRLRGSANLEIFGNYSQFRKLNFAGYFPAARHAFTGPTFAEAGSQGDTQPDDKSLWPMTFHHELYNAGVVKTRINSFTTVGFSTNETLVASVANGGEFDVEASYTAGESMDDVYVLTRYKTERNNISSPGSWYSIWNSTYSMLDVTNEIKDVVAEYKDRHSPTFDISGSDEAYRRIFTRFLQPTPDEAQNVSARAKKVIFDKAWERCTSGRNPTNVVEGTFTPGTVAIERFDVGEGYTNVVVNGTVGSFNFYFGDAETLKGDERRSSFAVGYEKRGLPFAYWNFPSMNGNN